MIKLKGNKAITLIALVITIVIMLILVGVTVTVALKGELFSTAKKASIRYTKEQEKELIQIGYSEYHTQKYSKTSDSEILETYFLGKEINSLIDESKSTEDLIVFIDIGIQITNDDVTGSIDGKFIYVGFEYNNNKYVLTCDSDAMIIQKLEIQPVLKVQDAVVTGDEEEGWEIVFENSGNKYILLSDGKIIDESEEPEGWTKTEKPAKWNNDKVVAVTDGTNIIPLPEGYQISHRNGEHTIEEGLVIRDSNQNEFVWIPASNFASSYAYSSNYSEPTELSADTQSSLDKYYGENYYNYDTDFNYNSHYAEMVQSVNKYGGFYIGRYETTIDGDGNIGSKANTTVLTAGMTLNEAYYYRWWGMYAGQRKSNVVGNNDYVQTNMIWGQQWDAMIEFIGNEKAKSTITGTQSGIMESGKATYDEGVKDVINNVYDLRGNAYDWTAEYGSVYHGYRIRVPRGGQYNHIYSADTRDFYCSVGQEYTGGYATRITLYIK